MIYLPNNCQWLHLVFRIYMYIIWIYHFHFSSSSYDSGKDVWINCDDRKKSKNFVWGDGVAVSWSNWEKGQPNNYYSAPNKAHQDCCEMEPSYKLQWNDEICKFKNAYVCQSDKGEYLLCVSIKHMWIGFLRLNLTFKTLSTWSIGPVWFSSKAAI